MAGFSGDAGRWARANILINPDGDSVERARAVNARLRQSVPSGFALDASHQLHITTLQRSDRSLVAHAGSVLGCSWEWRRAGAAVISLPDCARNTWYLPNRGIHPVMIRYLAI
jgi:hypothetical protein